MLFAPGWLFNCDGENEEAEEEQVSYLQQETKNNHFFVWKIIDISHSIKISP